MKGGRLGRLESVDGVFHVRGALSSFRGMKVLRDNNGRNYRNVSLKMILPINYDVTLKFYLIEYITFEDPYYV